jgi:hypothetical protein
MRLVDIGIFQEDSGMEQTFESAKLQPAKRKLSSLGGDNSDQVTAPSEFEKHLSSSLKGSCESIVIIGIE